MGGTVISQDRRLASLVRRIAAVSHAIIDVKVVDNNNVS